MSTTVGSSAPTLQSLDDTEALDLHVVVMTNFIPTHRLPVFVELERRVRKLTILLSTPMESNRDWEVDWGGLDVTVQKTLTITRNWRHAKKFDDTSYLHIPWNAVFQLVKLRPDIVISCEMGARSTSAMIFRRLFPSTRFVMWAAVSEYTEQYRGRLRTWFRKLLLSNVDAMLVNGTSGISYLQKLGYDVDRIVRFDYPALESFYERGTDTRDARVAHRLLIVGQLIPRKGLLPFLEAIRRAAQHIDDRTIDLTIVGSGPLQTEIESQQLPENVTVQILGQLGFDQIVETMLDSGILAFPTLLDDWGMVVNEAMATGLPVLGSVYSQAVFDLCDEGETGWRFRPDHPEEMKQAILTALNTPVDDLNCMRESAREKVKRRTPLNGAQNWVTAIKRALND